MTTDTPSSLPAYADSDLARLGTEALIETVLADEDRVPRNVIDACAGRGDDMVQQLRAFWDSGQGWRAEATVGEMWLLLHSVMILGLMTSESAGRLLVQCMVSMSQAGDDDLQDWLAGYWAALFRNKPEGMAPALRAVGAERSLDWYVRANAVEAVLAAAQRQGVDALAEALDWVAAIAADPQEDMDMRLNAGGTLLRFPRPRYRPLLDSLAGPRNAPGTFFGPDEVDLAYTLAEDTPEWEGFMDPWKFYLPEEIESRQRRWAEEDAELDTLDDDWLDDTDVDLPELTYVRPVPKTGRNDPCPCGSGRKYKKCCLERDEAAANAGLDATSLATRPNRVYQIKVTLQHVHPPVWRRLQVASDTRLNQLHFILQATMGWSDSHLHQFVVGRACYGVPSGGEFADLRDERRARLDAIAAPGDKLIYEYDFGDSWLHELDIEQVLPPDADVPYPRCLAGANACPPEDCGGPPGYARLLEALRDPANEEYAEILDWLGDEFDPQAFDLDEVNRELQGFY